MENVFLNVSIVDSQTKVDVKGSDEDLSSMLANMLVFEKPIRRLIMMAITKSVQVIDVKKYYSLVERLTDLSFDNFTQEEIEQGLKNLTKEIKGDKS